MPPRQDQRFFARAGVNRGTVTNAANGSGAAAMHKRLWIHQNAQCLRAGVLLLGVGAVLWAGCRPGPVPEPEVPALREQISALQAELEEARATHTNGLAMQAAELEAEYQRRYDGMESTLRRQVYDLTQTIRQLRQDLETAQSAGADASTPSPAAESPASAPGIPDPLRAVAEDSLAVYSSISEYVPPPPDLSNFIDPPEGPDPDLFPIAVEDARASAVVVGTHTTSRMVETGEVLKDAFGQEKPILRQERYEADDYAYRATFRLRNRTRSPQEVRFRCGQETGSILLAPGETRSCTVGALVGAPLRVGADGSFRNFPVSHAPQGEPTP